VQHLEAVRADQEGSGREGELHAAARHPLGTPIPDDAVSAVGPDTEWPVEDQRGPAGRPHRTVRLGGPGEQRAELIRGHRVLPLMDISNHGPTLHSVPYGTLPIR